MVPASRPATDGSAEPPSTRPGRRGSWLGSLTGAPDTEPSSTRPSTRTGAPDPLRSEFWAAYCYLFPPHALVTQNESGSLVISWSMTGDPHAQYKYAAPVMLRFEPELLAMLQVAPPDQRKRIIAQQEAVVRGGLVGYDPYAGTQARIIVLG